MDINIWKNEMPTALQNHTQSTWFWLAVVVIYFLPAVIAAVRNHHNTPAIFILNLLAGWTAIGWLAAIVWSMTATKQTASTKVKPPETKSGSKTKACPYCAEEIKAAAIICRYCKKETP